MMRRKNKSKNGNSKGNQVDKPYWWEIRATIVQNQQPDQITAPTIGRPPKFESAEELWYSITEYFKWVEENPLYEDRAFIYKGKVLHANIKRMRAMTIQGLSVFLGMIPVYWHELKNQRGEDFTLVCTAAEAVMYNQKFTGAAASLLKESIIARDLGLKELHEHSGPGGGPIKFESVQPDMTKLTDRELFTALKLAEKTNVKQLPERTNLRRV